jgi:hypothetical protein
MHIRVKLSSSSPAGGRLSVGCAELVADHPDVPLLKAEATRLRDEYQALIRAALEANRPVPPPFPETPHG